MNNESELIKKNERNSSIELLRIISMFLIALCHFATHGGFEFEVGVLTLPRLWYNFIEMGGNLGVDVFVLISGYFLIKNTENFFNIKRILKFWGQIIFYSVVIYFFSVISGIESFGIVSFVKSFLPITFESWWFASTYLMLYIIHPFLNVILNKVDKSVYRLLLVILVVCWSVIPTFGFVQYQSNDFLWFITLYCIAGYIRLYGLNDLFKKKHYVVLFILFTALRYLSSIVIILLSGKVVALGSFTFHFYDKNSVLTLLCAMALFMIFEKTNLGYHKTVNAIASCAFGVYLIHDSSVIRPLLWKTIFKNYEYQNSVMIIPYSVGVVISVYLICTLIDLLRQKIFEKPFIILVNKYSDKVFKPVEKVIDVFKNIVFGK